MAKLDFFDVDYAESFSSVMIKEVLSSRETKNGNFAQKCYTSAGSLTIVSEKELEPNTKVQVSWLDQMKGLLWAE